MRTLTALLTWLHKVSLLSLHASAAAVQFNEQFNLLFNRSTRMLTALLT
jgi:hypothetical protein